MNALVREFALLITANFTTRGTPGFALGAAGDAGAQGLPPHMSRVNEARTVPAAQPLARYI